MTALLSKAGSSLTVKQLLDTLQEVLDFESSLAKKYATPVSQPTQVIKATCLIYDQMEDILNATQPAGASRPSKTISSTFESHMGVFVSAQDK